MEMSVDSNYSSSHKKDKSKHSSSNSNKELNYKKKSSHKSHQHSEEDFEEGEETSPPSHRSDDLVVPSKRRNSASTDEEEPKKSHKSSSKKSSHRDEKSSSSNSKKHKSDDNKEKERDKRSSKSEKHSQKNEEKSSIENGSSNAGSSGGGGDISLSIEETNKLRAKLGLKPLSSSENKQTESKSTNLEEGSKKKYIDKDTNQEFEHIPAENLADKKEQKTFKEKLEQQREKRKLLEKLSKTKGIGNDLNDEDVDSASAWLNKLKQKEEANKKAKMLEEMDEQFGISDIVEKDLGTSFKKPTKKTQSDYTASNLTGLRVEHDETVFQEGREVILTLKDRNILRGKGDDLDVDDDDEADVLVNVNIMDDEKAAKNVENKKNKIDYKPYDDFDEDGNFRERSILDKYNEELEGERKKSFKLGKQGVYDASDSKFIERLNEEHKAKAIKLDILNELKFATDYYTPQEVEKFKKPKKIRKALRKNKVLKADDLLPLAEQAKPVVKRRVDVNDSATIKSESTYNESQVISLKGIDFGLNKNSDDEDGEVNEEDESETSDDDFDAEKLKRSTEDKALEQEILEEENNALEELHNVLSKTRNKSIFSKTSLPDIKLEQEENEKETEANKGVDFDKLNKMVVDDEEDQQKALTLDTMSEFCRNLGDIPYGAIGKRNRDKNLKTEDNEDDEDLDEVQVNKNKISAKSLKKQRDNENMDTDDDEDFEKKPLKNQSDEEEGSDFEMDKDLVKSSDEEDNVGILEDEPTIDRGLASCLKLALTKGYLGHEKSKQNARLTKAPIEAINFTIEEKNYYDIDDKYNRNRDRFSGPLMDFEEKSNYKPDVKLDYIDEKGHNMNEKEAFRYLSHKFHGKGSGKKKTEKRFKKIKEMESMNKMSSVDTPLNTVALLVEKQKKLQQPFVVLSTQKGKQDQVTLHKR